MERKLLLSACALLVGSASFGQGSFFMLDYSVGFTGGELKEYIEKESWRGIAFGYRNLVNDNVAVGFDLSSNMFYEAKDRATYTWETTSITGYQYRYNYTLAMTGNVDYVLAPGADIRPYVGLGLGTVYVYRRTNFGIYQLNQDDWQFLLQPEAGLSFYVSDGTAFNVSANYFAGFDTQDMSGQNYLTANVGLIWSLD